MDASNDLKWKKQSTSKQLDIPVPPTDASYLPQSDRRIGLVISAPLAGTVWLSWGGGPAVVGQGLGLTAGGYPLQLTLEIDGAIVHGPIRAIMSAGTVVVSCIETLAPPT